MEVASLSVQNICYSSVQGNRRPPTRQICENTGSHSPLWRPWILTARDMDRQRWRRQNSHPHMETANQESVRQTIPSLFTHPVRLLWPRNKCFDYLYSEGQELLAAFPVQASISFYMESDSEEENEELDEGDELEEESAMEETVSEKITEQKITDIPLDEEFKTCIDKTASNFGPLTKQNLLLQSSKEGLQMISSDLTKVQRLQSHHFSQIKGCQLLISTAAPYSSPKDSQPNNL
ncbi:uncharacterized protein LOC144493160 [Mustelus asterias]